MSRKTSGYEPKRLKHAKKILEKTLGSNNIASMPSNSFDGLVGFALITVNKGGIIISSEFGTGLFIGRLSYKNNIKNWTGPVFVKLSGAEIGLNIGMAKTDHFIIFYDDAAVQKFLKRETPKITFDSHVEGTNDGSEESKAKKDIRAWALTSKGLFITASLEGKILSIDDKKTRKYYGFDYDVDRILSGILSGEIMPPYNADYDRIIQILEHRIPRLRSQIPNNMNMITNTNNNNVEAQPHIQNSSETVVDHKVNTKENPIQKHEGDLIFDKTSQQNELSNLKGTNRPRGNSSASDLSVTPDLSRSPSLSRSISPDNQMEVIQSMNDRDEEKLMFSDQGLNLPIGDKLNVNDNYNETYKKGIENNSIPNSQNTTVDISTNLGSDRLRFRDDKPLNLPVDRLNDTFPSSSSTFPNTVRNLNEPYGISEKPKESINNIPIHRGNENYFNTNDKLNFYEDNYRLHLPTGDKLNVRENFEEHHDRKNHTKPQSETSWERVLDINALEKEQLFPAAKSIPKLEETQDKKQYPSSNISNVSNLSNSEYSPVSNNNIEPTFSEYQHLKNSTVSNLPNMNEKEEHQRISPLESVVGVAKKAKDLVQSLPLLQSKNENTNNVHEEKITHQPHTETTQTYQHQTKSSQPLGSENLKLSSTNFNEEEHHRNRPLEVVTGAAKKATEFVQNLPIFHHETEKSEQVESNNLKNVETKKHQQEISQTLPKEETTQNSLPESSKGLLTGVKEKISEQSHLASEKAKQLIGNMRSTHEKESIKPNENLESKPISKSYDFKLEKEFVEQPVNQSLLNNISSNKLNVIEEEKIPSTVSNEQKPSLLNTAKEKVIGLSDTVQQKMVEAKDVVVGQTQKLRESIPMHKLTDIIHPKPSIDTSNEISNNMPNTLPISNEILPSHMYCNTLPSQERSIPLSRSNIVTEKPIPLEENENLLSKAKEKGTELKETVQQKIVEAKDIVTGQTKNNKESAPLHVPIDTFHSKPLQESVAPLPQSTLFEGHEKSIPEVYTQDNIRIEKKGPIVVDQKLTEEQIEEQNKPTMMQNAKEKLVGLGTRASEKTKELINSAKEMTKPAPKNIEENVNYTTETKPQLTEEVVSSTPQESSFQSAKNKIVELKDVAMEKGANMVEIANTKTKELMEYLKPKNEQNDVKFPDVQPSSVQYVPEKSLDKEKTQINDTTSHTIPLLQYAKNKASELSTKVMEKSKEFIDTARDFVESDVPIENNQNQDTLLLAVPNRNNLTSSITSDVHKNPEILPNNNTSNLLQSSLLPNNKDQIYNNSPNTLQSTLLPNNNNSQIYNNNQLYNNNTLNPIQPVLLDNNGNPILITTTANPFEAMPNNNVTGVIPTNNPYEVLSANNLYNPVGVIPTNNSYNLVGIIPNNNPFQTIPTNNPFQTIPTNNPYDAVSTNNLYNNPYNHPYGVTSTNNPYGVTSTNNPYGVISTNNPIGVVPVANPFEQVSYGIPNSEFLPNTGNIQTSVIEKHDGNTISRKTETIQNNIPVIGINGELQQQTTRTTTHETINKQPDNYIFKNLNDEQEG